MRRLFWVALGAAAGVVAVRRVTRAAQTFTPQGLSSRAGGIGDKLRAFAEEVRAGMAERERELRDALGLDEQRELDPRTAAEVTTHPTRRTTS